PAPFCALLAPTHFDCHIHSRFPLWVIRQSGGVFEMCPVSSQDKIQGLRASEGAQGLMIVLLYRRTGNLRAVQLLLGHRKIESTVRYLGIEVDDALAIAEQVDV